MEFFFFILGIVLYVSLGIIDESLTNKREKLMSDFEDFYKYKKILTERTQKSERINVEESDEIQVSDDNGKIILTRPIYAQDGKVLIGVAQCNEVIYRIKNGTEKIAKGAFQSNQATRRIEIPASVTNIDNSAFDGCKCIEWYEVDPQNEVYYSINGVLYEKSKNVLFKYPIEKQDNSFYILSNTTEIADKAFKGCAHLREIFISSSVIAIHPNAFEKNCNLRDINVDDKNSYYTSIDGVLYDKEVKKLVLFVNKDKSAFTVPSTVTHIGCNAFSHCHQIKNIFLPKEISIIGDLAFSDCCALQSIILPDGVISIGNWAFEDCVSLSEISIPAQLYSLGKWAFKNCTSLTNIILPNTLTTIENGCFEQCTALKSIVIPSSITTIGESAFTHCSALSHVELSPKTTLIKDWAFSHCTSLSEIELPQSIQSIGLSAFECCESLLSIAIPPRVKEIRNATFKECKKLFYIDFPPSVCTIGQWAFGGCSSLTDITLPNTITQIESWAFCQCGSLATITLPKHLEQLKKWILWQCPQLETIDLPTDLKEIEDWAFNECGKLSSLYIFQEDPSTLKLGKEAFERTLYDRCTLHVPADTKENYLKHPVFSKFKQII